MRPELVPALRCPFCLVDAGLVMRATGMRHGYQGAVRNGDLRCDNCGRSSEIVNGIWDAMGERRPPRTLAQVSNMVPPTPQLYERVWRKRSLSLLSGRSFPNSEELHELRGWLSPLAPGSTIVDVGCSEGLYARAMASLGHTVIAIDHSRRFLERTAHRGRDLPIVCVRSSAQFMPIASASIHATMIGGTLNEIGDQTKAANEMARVCKPGGLLFNMSLTRATTARGRLLQALLRPSGVTFPTTSETRDLYERAGFTIDRMRADGVVLRVDATRRPSRDQPSTAA
jgi:SAM-dependent methyltransferase